MDGSLFISYSHLDTEWMRRVKQHLEGMLRGRCKVWTDESIAPGTSWEETLRSNLNQASAGFVLVSPEYLVSEWCRRELAILAQAHADKRLGAVFWLLLRPCGWKWSELNVLQAVQEPADRALLDEPPGPIRDAMLLHACDRIAAGVTSIVQSEDPVLSGVRRLLREAGRDIKLAGEQTPVKGDFSVVCRGLRPNGDDVYIKVLTNTPLHRMRELFRHVSDACRTVTHPSVIKVDEVFTHGTGYDERIVILSAPAPGEPLSKVMTRDAALPPAERHLQPDRVRSVLLRIAEALEQLHRLGSVPWPGEPPGERAAPAYRHPMGPLVPGNIFYDRITGRPLVSLVGVTNFIWHFFEPETFRRIVNPGSGQYVLPEKAAGGEADTRADQYFLGMLALELLEARPLFLAASGAAPLQPLAFLREQASHHWAGRHDQLRALLERLLQPQPADRFADMGAVVAELRALEDSARALAKYSYRAYIAGGADAGAQFSQAFYARFFERCPEVRELFVHTRAQRLGKPVGADEVPDDAHHAKLLDALKSVLNHRRGAAPSSIDSVARGHVRFAITAAQYVAFEIAFLDTLAARMQQSERGRAEAAEVQAAWRELFVPVMDEMGRVG
jgi:hemoglobin-like flavoprotein